MGCIIKFLGRLLFVTLLISCAYLHISKPQNYQKDFAHGYEHISEHLNQFYPLPAAVNVGFSLIQVNWNMWIQIYGALQGLIALLIIFGDRFGGILLLISLIVSGTARFCQIHQFLQWDSSKQLEVKNLLSQFTQFLTMVGASLILSSSTKKRASCQ